MNRTPPKFSFTTMGTPGRPLGAILELAQHFGFSGVDLRCSTHLGELQPGAEAQELEPIQKQLAEAHLEVPSLLCYPETRTGDTDWPARLEAELFGLLRTGAALGARAVRIFGPPLGDGANRSLLRELGSVIRATLERSTSPTRLLIQNHKGGLTVRDCVSLVAEVQVERFGIVYCPDHGYAYDSLPIDEQWGLVAPHAGLIYLSDLSREGDGFSPVLPGNGQVPLSETISSLSELGFSGYWSFKWEKIWHRELPEFEVAAPHFFALAGISQLGPK